MTNKIWNSMTGKKQSLVVFAVAIVLAGLATVWTYNALKGKASVQKAETVQIIVATQDLSWGAVLTKEMIKTVPYLRDNLPAGYLTDSATLEGRTVIYPVKLNEPILESRLAPTDVKGGGVAAVVAPNMRAMAVKVDKVVGVSGFIHPGNRVDVLVTLSGQEKVTTAIAKTVLENVLVLATGTEIEQSGNKGKATPVDVITLQVSPEEGEKLALAAVQGTLLLSLRNFTDTQDVRTKGATIPVLLSSYASTSGLSPIPKGSVKKVVSRRQAAAPAGSQSYTVEIVRGNDVDHLRFGKGE